ncbi:MAG TPA: pyridoxal phosphatase [Telmatospirillum sp.]|nr:pyridoxal phosphatase [Telmatospirillum sp.]
MNRTSYRLIALDLDGTALDSTGTIQPSTKTAVRNALDRGVTVVLVTGRHHVATAPFHRELGLKTPAICCNGAYVYDFATQRAIVGDPMSPPQARHMLEICRRHDVHCLLYTSEAMTYEIENPHIARLKAWADSFIPSLRPELRQVASFERLIDNTPFLWKFVVSHDDPRVLSSWSADAQGGGDYAIEYSWTDRVDVTKAGNSKGRRLIEWASSQNIEPSEIIAFGDNHNDLSMIRAVGFGVAMGNAEAALKADAAWVTTSNDRDGIATALERYLV